MLEVRPSRRSSSCVPCMVLGPAFGCACGFEWRVPLWGPAVWPWALGGRGSGRSSGHRQLNTVRVVHTMLCMGMYHNTSTETMTHYKHIVKSEL